MRAFAVGQRREMAATVVVGWGAVTWPAASSGLASPAIAMVQSCGLTSKSLERHWFEPDGGEIADLLVGLTDARKTWGFGLCFLDLRNVKGHPWNHKRVHPLADR